MTQNEKQSTPRRIIVKRKQVKIEPNEIESDNPLDTTIEHSYDESKIISDMHERSQYENKRTSTHNQIQLNRPRYSPNISILSAKKSEAHA